ncbi:MAG: helix-turn-helix transcriptional regulator [Pseudomonadota bacterium]
MSGYIVSEFRYAPGGLSKWRPDERTTANPQDAVPKDEICLSILPPGPTDAKFVVPSAFVDINLGPSPTLYGINSDQRTSAVVPENTFGFVTAGTDLHLTSKNAVPCILLEIGDDVLADWSETADVKDDAVLPFGGYREDRIIGTMGRLAGSLLSGKRASDTPADVMMMEAIVLGISSRLMSSLSNGSSNRDWRTKDRSTADRRLAHGLDYAMTNLSDPDLKVADMAAQANISPHHFAELFKASKGISPYAFVRAERLKLAKQMLETTMMSIAGIAHETGFSSQSHLTTAFRETFGVTPGRHRASS